MKAKPLPFNQEYLRSILDYSIITGKFYWKKTGKGRKSEAGTKTQIGYIYISIYHKKYKASRLGWLWVTGEDPLNFVIDHINPERNFDNSWVNLRKATYSQNNSNKKCINKIKFKGVSQKKNKYQAQVTIKNKPIYIGLFDTPEEAHKAYCKYAQEMYGEFFRAN